MARRWGQGKSGRKGQARPGKEFSGPGVRDRESEKNRGGASADRDRPVGGNRQVSLAPDRTGGVSQKKVVAQGGLSGGGSRQGSVGNEQRGSGCGAGTKRSANDTPSGQLAHWVGTEAEARSRTGVAREAQDCRREGKGLRKGEGQGEPRGRGCGIRRVRRQLRGGDGRPAWGAQRGPGRRRTRR